VYVNSAGAVVLQTTAGGAVYGILQDTPQLGQPARVGLFGITKAVAGAAITAGAQLDCDAAGRVVTHTAGIIVGIALESASAAGQIIAVAIAPTGW
jgi:hypothetical protein